MVFASLKSGLYWTSFPSNLPATNCLPAIGKNQGNRDSTGSLTMKCAKVKAYVAQKYWLSFSKLGFWTFTISGHLWKCKTNLS